MKTFILWPGNKSKYVSKYIKPHIPQKYNTYIEPFVGSGALFLNIKPDKWIINDINLDLINVWINVKTNHKEIIKYFKRFEIIFTTLQSNKDKIEYIRKKLLEFLKLDYNTKRASYYLLLKFCSYMGVILIKNKYQISSLNMHVYNNKYFFLRKNYYNKICDASEFINSSNGQIYNVDYKKILSKAKKNDFVFLDPPYIEDHKYAFEYNKDEILDHAIIEELLGQVKKLDKKGVKWLMTQADTTIIRNTFKDYYIDSFQVYRRMNNSHKKELIIKNY